MLPEAARFRSPARASSFRSPNHRDDLRSPDSPSAGSGCLEIHLVTRRPRSIRSAVKLGGLSPGAVTRAACCAPTTVVYLGDGPGSECLFAIPGKDRCTLISANWYSQNLAVGRAILRGFPLRLAALSVTGISPPSPGVLSAARNRSTQPHLSRAASPPHLAKSGPAGSPATRDAAAAPN